jgi:hypothetical protein
MFRWVLLLCLAAICAADDLFIHSPFILAHDSASGYLQRDNIVTKYTITQTGSITEQLNCGTRAFDLRPYLDDGALITHHGPVKIKVSLQDILQEVVTWKETIDNQDELIVLYISHCEGDDSCVPQTKALFNHMKISYIDDCQRFASLTYKEASDMKIMGIFDCVEEQYDESVNCYGFQDHKKFTCYGENAQIPFEHLSNYWNTSLSISNNAVSPYMSQLHWQSTAESIAMGELHLSSVLKDESKAGVNRWILQQLQEKNDLLDKMNFIELNNVCDYGNELHEFIIQHRH